MKITFIEDHKGRPSRFEYLKHSIRKSGHEVQETSATSPLPEATDVLILADANLSAPQTPHNYPVLDACEGIAAQLRIVLAQTPADGVLDPGKWSHHLDIPVDNHCLLAILDSFQSQLAAK